MSFLSLWVLDYTFVMFLDERIVTLTLQLHFPSIVLLFPKELNKSWGSCSPLAYLGVIVEVNLY